LKSANFTRVSVSRSLVILGTLLLFMVFQPTGYAQEEDLFGDVQDDSLLFGDDFDLGGDDISFDFEVDSGSDDSFSFDELDETDAAGTEEDFFGDFENETADLETVADTSGIGDEWGLDDSADYEKLITKTVKGEESAFKEKVTDHPLDFRRYVEGTIFEGTGLTVSLYSPQYVAEGLTTWYSYVDFSLTTEFPWRFLFDPVALSFSLDISSFNFDNSFPAGGNFKGVTVMPMIRVESYGIELEVGAGLYYPTYGVMAGIGYSYKFHSLFASAGYRWNWVAEIDPIGTSWWAEPRFTAGIKLW